MVEQNPLNQDIPISSSTNDEVSNKKGRPRKENIIRFGPEPQSMISKLFKLNNTKVVDSNNSRSSAILPNNEDYVHDKHTIQAEPNHSTTARNHNQSINKKGRPIKGNITQFGPQPQSMVSKSLCKLKADHIFQLANEKHDCDIISIPSTPMLESEETEDDVYPKKPKRRKKTKKVKVPDQPKTYSCNFENCAYFTKLASNMTKHKRIHTGEKPYLCDRCSFRSNFINSLKSHKRLHTEVRPYKCSDCGYSCNSISNLKKHCDKRHKHLPIVQNLEK